MTYQRRMFLAILQTLVMLALCTGFLTFWTAGRVDTAAARSSVKSLEAACRASQLVVRAGYLDLTKISGPVDELGKIRSGSEDKLIEFSILQSSTENMFSGTWQRYTLPSKDVGTGVLPHTIPPR